MFNEMQRKQPGANDGVIKLHPALKHSHYHRCMVFYSLSELGVCSSSHANVYTYIFCFITNISADLPAAGGVRITFVCFPVNVYMYGIEY